MLASLLSCLLALVGAVWQEPAAGLPDEPPPEHARVLPGLELSYPADHGSHPAYRTEWWYVTGQLVSADGRRFGYQWTVFRQASTAAPERPGESPLRARQVLLGHLALTDVAREDTRFAQRLRRAGSPLASAATGDLDVVLEDWSLRREEGDRLVLRAGEAAHGIRLELELVPEKPLVLHGEGGVSAKGGQPGNASAYASWTRLSTSGRLTLDGEALGVDGASWFDHEFGSSVLPTGVVGWDWFGLQLADGRDLMLFLLRRADGSDDPASAGTLVEADGRARHLSAADLRLASHASWTSPHTGASYPARWTIAVPSADLELEVVPLVADCELVDGGSTGLAYWEGPVELRGTSTGRGYAELTGYAGTMEGRF